MGLEVFIITHICPQDTKNRVTLEEANPGWTVKLPPSHIITESVLCRSLKLWNLTRKVRPGEGMSTLSSANSLIFLSSSPADKQQSVQLCFQQHSWLHTVSETHGDRQAFLKLLKENECWQQGADLCQVYSPGGSKHAQTHFRMCQTLVERNTTGMSPETVWFKSKLSEKSSTVWASRQPFDVSELRGSIV